MAHHPSRLIIDGDALVANWRWLAKRSGEAACGAAVKADGYGLGALETVRRLADAGCRDFFVATWAEAEALMPWAEGLTLSVLHGIGPDDLADALNSPARPVLNTPAQVARWREHGGTRPCDLMVDTGMNRLGLTGRDARSAIEAGLKVHTLMSHLACADEPDHPLNEIQLHRFQFIRRELPVQRYSLANSAGICLGLKYAFGLTRPGLAIYGGVPVPGNSEQDDHIRPVVSIDAQLIQLRDVPAGATIGYGATFKATHDMTVGIINLGYADGFLRMLGQGGAVRAEGQRFQMVGRISMDLIAVDLTQPRIVQSIAVAGDGKIERSTNTLDQVRFSEGDWLSVDYHLPQVSMMSGLSQYELLTGLGHRFERRWR